MGGLVYKPDFYLPHFDVFLEVKYAYPYINEIEKCERLLALGSDVVLLYGDVRPPQAYNNNDRMYAPSGGLRGMKWRKGIRLNGDYM